MSAARADRSRRDPDASPVGPVPGRDGAVAVRLRAGARWVRGRWWLVPVGMFVGLRVATLVVAWLAQRDGATPTPLFHLMTVWDANWNAEIAAHGYSRAFGVGQGQGDWLTLAFFPVVPMSARLVHVVTGLSVDGAGIVVGTLAGLGGAVAVWRVVEERLGDDVASDAVLLLLVSPAAFVLGLFYTEGPMLLMVGFCFLALHRRRWTWAGLAALVAGCVRPNGFLLVVPCLVAAVVAIRRDGEWRSLVAPLLAPLGFLAWVLWVAHRTGELTGYFRVQSDAWGARIDFGANSARALLDVARLRLGGADAMATVVAVVLLGLVGLGLGVRHRLDPVWLAYAVAVVVLTVVNARVASGARMLLPAFPLFVAWALTIPRRWLPTVAAMSAVVMGAFYLSALGGGVLTP